MDLRRHLLELLAPSRIGDEVVPGARLTGASEELGLRLTFDVAGVDVHVEIALGELPGPAGARSRRLKFSYRAGSGDATVDPRAGIALCQAVARIAEGHEDAVLAAIERDAAGARTTEEAGARIREVRVDQLLMPASGGRTRHYTLSPYVGCLIGCRFCYAQSRVNGVRRLSQLPDVPWGSYVDVRMNAAEVLARELEALPERPIKFCPIVSDPYQVVEKRYGVTRACLEVLRDSKVARPTMILTRSRLVERDAELIASLPLGYAGCSIPTVDDTVRRHFEPRGSAIGERLGALATLRAAGARTFAVVQPLLPGSVVGLADALAAVVSSVSIDVLHGVEGAAEEFADPEYAYATSPTWQAERAHELAELLRARGVAIWDGELPVELLAT